MMVAVAKGVTPGSEDIVVLGLTKDNVRELKKDRPILKDLRKYTDHNMQICIVYGDEMDDLKELMKPFIGVSTQVHEET